MRQRAHFIDLVRGLLILYVMAYHLLYDITVLFGYPLPFFFSGWFQGVRVVAVSMLLFISGMVSGYSRSGLRRAAKLTGAAALVTAVSFVFLPREPIVFGVLHLYAACTLLYALMGHRIGAPTPWMGAVVCMGLFVLLLPMGRGWVGYGPLRCGCPRRFYRSDWLIPLGFAPAGFLSADYYPLLPWGCAFLPGLMPCRCGRAVCPMGLCPHPSAGFRENRPPYRCSISSTSRYLSLYYGCF